MRLLKLINLISLRYDFNHFTTTFGEGEWRWMGTEVVFRVMEVEIPDERISIAYVDG